MDRGEGSSSSISRRSSTAKEFPSTPPQYQLKLLDAESQRTVLDDSGSHSAEADDEASRLNHTQTRHVPSSPSSPPSRAALLWIHLLHHARTQFPAASRRIEWFEAYLRGPRPKQELPGPTPYLDTLGKKFAFRPERSVLQFRVPWLYILFIPAYVIGITFLIRAQFYQTPAESLVSCTSTYWLANDQCGLNGNNCDSFGASNFDFKCPSRCDDVILLNPRTVGDEAVNKVPLLVGGGDANRTYRADSFLCAAAIHAGLFDNGRGGCASLQLMGNFTDFLGSTAHGLTSIGFPTVFPMSYRLSPNTGLTHCSDLRDYALAFNVVMMVVLFVLLRPKAIVLYWCMVCVGYWHVIFFSQPAGFPPPIDEAFGGFLPALFVAYAFWRLAFRFVLPVFANVPIERTFWYLGSFWPGVLLNVVTAKIPLDRLIPSDIEGDAGAIAALVVIIILLFCVGVNQARIMRKTGYFYQYAFWYILGALIAIIMSQLPNLTFRLHHYILAMAIIPATGFPTRLSIILQGFFLGMFLNGTAAFGFDSILQTAEDLRRDAPIGTVLPRFSTNSTTYNTSIPFGNQTISWQGISSDDDDIWNGFALLVDDVLRFSGSETNFSLASLNASLPHFFRLAFQNNGASGDFTKAATLWPNGTWVDPLPGPS